MIRDLAELASATRSFMSSMASAVISARSAWTWAKDTTEFLHLEYANETKLYVPVAQLHLIGALLAAPIPTLRRCTSLASGDWDERGARPPSRCVTRPPNC